MGQAEITKAIASADRMAVISSAVAGQVVHKLAIVGSSIINGVTHVWQVVACGIQDALLAMNSFFARIGASIQKMVEFLAWMFNWNDFLRASDGIYHSITGALDQVPTLMQSLSQYKGQILDSLTLPTDLPKQSLAQMCGLGIPANMGAKAVSYTHLDVYKRQSLSHPPDKERPALRNPRWGLSSPRSSAFRCRWAAVTMKRNGPRSE